MNKTLATLMLLVSVSIGGPVFAAEPSLHEVYQAANGGKMDDAQRMMREVLQAHPASAKAHYVEAELLARQGQLKQAAGELATAEKLAPGLPFAKPESVTSLKESINRHAASPAVTPVQHVSAPAPSSESGFSGSMLLIGLGLIAFVAWASRFMAKRNAPQGNMPGSAQPEFGAYRPAYPAGPYGGAAQGPVYGQPTGAPAASTGFGSQMLGGLATGAAVGAGVVAGEALMHRFMDGHKTPAASDQAFSSFDRIPDLPSTPLNDMGGNDFGIADNASWDDGGDSGNSDWT